MNLILYFRKDWMFLGILDRRPRTNWSKEWYRVAPVRPRLPKNDKKFVYVGTTLWTYRYSFSYLGPEDGVSCWISNLDVDISRNFFCFPEPELLFKNIYRDFRVCFPFYLFNLK